MRSDRGATEIALVVSIFVAALSIAVVAAALYSFTRATSQASLETQAADAAQSVFELANATPWRDLAHSGDDAGLSDAIVEELAAGQPLVTQGEFDEFDPTPAVVEGGTENYGTINENFTVYTSITWDREPPTSSVTSEYADMFGTKRMNVMVVWGDGERESQTFTALRSPTVAEAVPTGINVLAGGGLNIERDIDAPILVGDHETGELEATMAGVYRWELQMAWAQDMDDHEVLCEGEYSEIQDAVEECTYEFTESVGFTPSFRLKVWTLDTDDANSSADGVKYSEIVSFPGPTIAALTGGKVEWDTDQIFWEPTVGLMGAEYNGSDTVETVVSRDVAGQETDETVLPYNIAGDTMTFAAEEGDAATYQVCTRVNGEPVACSDQFGPLYTITTPEDPELTGWRPSVAFHANYSWQSNADSYTGDGGTGVTYDIQQQSSSGSWGNLALDYAANEFSEVRPDFLANSLDFRETTVTVRVRVRNDAGFSDWVQDTVTVGELPTRPVMSTSDMQNAANGMVSATWSWTAGSHAESWDHESRTSESGSWGDQGNTTDRSVTRSGPFGSYMEVRARGVNEFGVSEWTSAGIEFGGPPTASPNVTQTPQTNAMFVQWTGVENAERYEFEYRRNMDCNATGGTDFAWYTDDSNARSVTFSSNVRGGDCISVRGRAVNEYGPGPWSEWTPADYTGMNSPSGSWYVRATATYGGGSWTASNVSCDTGSTVQHRSNSRQYDTSWGSFTGYTSWSATKTRSYGFTDGNRGISYWQARCINTETGATSSNRGTVWDDSHRLIDTSGSYFGTEDRRRLAQAINWPYPTWTGSHFSNFYPNANSYSLYTRRLQYDIIRDTNQNAIYNNYGSRGSDVDGLWGSLTTNGLVKLSMVHCGNSAGDGTGYSSHANGRLSWTSYKKTKLIQCLNSENFFGTWDSSS
jgi:hypothetical protein